MQGECGDVKIEAIECRHSDHAAPLPNVPLIHRPGEQPACALKRPPLDVRKRLLVVDDELPILKLVTRILATDNYEITSAELGRRGGAADRSDPGYPGVDLLVTDLMMPGMNGRELGDDHAAEISERARAVRHRLRGHVVQGCARSSATASRSSRSRSEPTACSKRRGC